jgi:dCMP deaminase
MEASIAFTETSKSTKWDLRFLDVAALVATWSKDRSTKVGCVIVGPHNDIRTVGYNGFPRYVDDTIESRHERPAKYKWTEHAERNAIYNAVLNHTSLHGCSIYLTWYPCCDCARAIIQCGIGRVVCAKRPDDSNPTYVEDFKITAQLFDSTGTTVVFPNG